MKLKYLIFKIVFILLIIACLAICTYVNLADRAAAIGTATAAEITPEPSEPLPVVQVLSEPSTELTPEPTLEPSPEPQYILNPADVTMLAKLVYGESRGIESITEQAAVIWTVLNRVDSTGYGMGRSIKYVVTFPDQFHGYSRYHPTVDDYGRDLCELAEDVLIRWMTEKDGQADVGRILPAEYKWFDGKNGHNHFRDAYKRSQANYYDWDLPSPYES